MTKTTRDLIQMIEDGYIEAMHVNIYTAFAWGAEVPVVEDDDLIAQAEDQLISETDRSVILARLDRYTILDDFYTASGLRLSQVGYAVHIDDLPDDFEDVDGNGFTTEEDFFILPTRNM